MNIDANLNANFIKRGMMITTELTTCYPNFINWQGAYERLCVEMWMNEMMVTT